MEKEKNNKRKKQKNLKTKSFKSKLIKTVSILLALILIITTISIIVNKSQEDKLFTVRNEKHLKNLIQGRRVNNTLESFAHVFAIPDYPDLFYGYRYNYKYEYDDFWGSSLDTSIKENISQPNMSGPNDMGGITPPTSEQASPDYSETNVQVEDIDEADIVKTDGEYVYSISDDKVIITDVRDKKHPIIVAEINSSNSYYPTDIFINKDKLVVISVNIEYRNSKTSVHVYDISNRAQPKIEKNLEVNFKYNTSRIIGRNVYIFAERTINARDAEIDSFREYKEDYKEKEIEFSKIKYIKTRPTDVVTAFVTFDLDKIVEDVNINSYLVDLETAYVSHNSVYLLDNSYSYNYRNKDAVKEMIKKLFGFRGVFAIFDDEIYYYNTYQSHTTVAKYSFSEDKSSLEFAANTKLNGRILNQYSCDEKDDNLRIALNDKKGTRIKVLDSKLKEIGDTGAVAPGEDNKSVRFVGDRAYFVTYKNIDPLYAIDLTDPTNPTIMGELKIPGFSTYLHPYDDNHIIGIGMATEEKLIRDSFGRPIRENITFNGMKMSLFDISDMKNPKEKDVIYFGDSRTDSPINKNPKALLYSKEKNLIAIPISNMGSVMPIPLIPYGIKEEVAVNDMVIHEKVEEGYIVFDLTVEGFKYRGIISHEKVEKVNKYSYWNEGYPLRGLYINDNLITISNKILKINDLKTLEFISNINLIENYLSKEEFGETYIVPKEKAE